jgi:hypothetical protein
MPRRWEGLMGGGRRKIEKKRKRKPVAVPPCLSLYL